MEIKWSRRAEAVFDFTENERFEAYYKEDEILREFEIRLHHCRLSQRGLWLSQNICWVNQGEQEIEQFLQARILTEYDLERVKAFALEFKAAVYQRMGERNEMV